MNPHQKRDLIKNFNSFDFLLLDINKKIYFLTICYSYFEGAIKTYYGSGFFFLSSGIDDLNDYFKVLRKKIIEIIESDPSLLKIKQNSAYENTVGMIESLYTSSEFLDILWDTNILPSLINLHEELNDKNLFENNAEIHPANVGVICFLREIDEQLNILEKMIQQNNDKFFTDPDDKNNKSNKKFETNKIIHEHTHRFENSIQEKEIEIKYAKETETKMSKTTLKDKEIRFEDDTAQIFIGVIPVPLPAYKNEHFFCRAIFSRKKGEVTDWSTIYQEMTGEKEPKDPKTNKKMVQDTMYAINERICEVLNTDNRMFVWKEKTVTRKY